MLETNKIYNMDCIEGMKLLDDNSIDAIVTDPPYELGFMGKSWDASGIAYNVAMWKEAYRVLKPGGHLLSFGGSRTYHRMACAIEDAGFEIRDQIMWIYGSGFPKSLNIGKAIDKQQNYTREIVGNYEPFGREGRNTKPTGNYNAAIGGNYTKQRDLRNIEIPSDQAKQWEGWGTALKPAHEPIVVARKPLAEKTVAENVLKYGTGGINIDESRISCEDNLGRNNKCNDDTVFKLGFQKNNDGSLIDNTKGLGRFPANFIHDGSDEVLELFPDSNSSNRNNIAIRKEDSFTYGGISGQEFTRKEFGDSGSAARFFYCAKASKSERNIGLDGFEEKEQSGSYQFRIDSSLDGKKTASRANNHPTVKPLKLMQYLVRLVTPKNGIVLDPFMGSGTTGMAAKSQGFKYIGFDMTKEYVEIAEARIKATEYQKKLLEE